MKLCDLTQFYSPASGGVKRYVSEKVRYLRAYTTNDEHVLIVPGECDEVIVSERSRTYFIASPLISQTSQYRVLLRLEAIERILEKERPDLIESGDPYQVAWKAIRAGAMLGIPVVGFYHSHFPEAYLRQTQKFLGRAVTEFFLSFAQSYVRNLYNRFERTIVPSPALGEVLTSWGVRHVVHGDLGVDTAIFHPDPEASENVRASFAIPTDRILLLYVGRLAQEKNTHTLFAAFRLLPRERFHLLVVGDGLQRKELATLKAQHSVTHLSYCNDSAQLAALYRAAHFFVHPGVQETFGLVTLEAQACGTPVVGISGSYMDRIILGDQTLWARENTAVALARAIMETVNRNDPREPAQLHARIAARYSWECVFARLFDLYRKVLLNYQRP